MHSTSVGLGQRIIRLNATNATQALADTTTRQHALMSIPYPGWSTTRSPLFISAEWRVLSPVSPDRLFGESSEEWRLAFYFLESEILLLGLRLN